MNFRLYRRITVLSSKCLLCASLGIISVGLARADEKPVKADSGHSRFEGKVPDILEYQALEALYHATSEGESQRRLSDWLQGDPIHENFSTWIRVYVLDGDIISLSLSEAFNSVGFDPNTTSHLPPEIGNLKALQYLNLNGNGIAGPVPAEIGNLTNLVELDLSANQFTALPPELNQLINLTSLNLTRNQLTHIPYIGNLKSLAYLSAGGNNLTSIPREVSTFTNLVGLSFDENPIQRIPCGISQLPKLGYLNLIECPLVSFPNFSANPNASNLGFFIYGGRIPVNDIAHNLTAPNAFPFAYFYYDEQAEVVGEPQQVCAEANQEITLQAFYNNHPQSSYQWYRLSGESWIEIEGATQISYSIANPENQHVGQYRCRVSNDWVTGVVQYSEPLTLTLGNCPPQSPKEPTVAASFTYENFSCSTLLKAITVSSPTCNVNTYAWDFGDGTTAIGRNPPPHTYTTPGTYTVKLTVNYRCNVIVDGEDCFNTSTLTEEGDITITDDTENYTEQLISIPYQRAPKVLSASATTYEDSWGLTSPSDAVAQATGYRNATQGVWRTSGSYVYDVPRESSPTVNTAQDGTFTLETFNQEHASFNAVPHWLPANSVTRYSPYGYELENRDVLGRHSAALYSYEGQLPHAIGTNMRYDEMAYTGFEYLSNKQDGNWQLGNQAAAAVRRYPVEAGVKHVVIVPTPLTELEDVDEVDVVARRLLGNFLSGNRTERNVPILCRNAHPDNPDWSVLVLGRVIMELPWGGQVIVRGKAQPSVTAPLDNTWAHSGKKSLKLTSNLLLPQQLLTLDSARRYRLGAWVSVKDLALPEPKLPNGIGIRVQGRNSDNQVTLSAQFYPSGPVVEGWQQLVGEFVYPGQSTALSLSFQVGSAPTVWFDDLTLHPSEGSMQAYVYDPATFRLQATLDEDGYATFYYYDAEGNLYLTKKETERGVQTLQETINYQARTN